MLAGRPVGVLHQQLGRLRRQALVDLHRAAGEVVAVPVDHLGDHRGAVLLVGGVVGGVALHDQLLGRAGPLVEALGVVGGGGGVVGHRDDHQRGRSHLVDHVDGPVVDDRLGAAQRHRRRDAVVDVGLDLGGPALGGGDHDLLAGVDHLALAGEHPPAPVGLETGQELVPLVLAAHPAQPVLAVGHRHLRHRDPHPAVGRGQQHRVAPAGAAAAEGADVVGVDVVAGAQVGDRVDQVLKLQLWQQYPPVAAGVPEAAVVEDQHMEARRGQGLVVGQVKLGILEPEPARPLHDGRRRGRHLRRGAQEAAEPHTLAEEGNLGLVHGRLPLPSPPDLSPISTFTTVYNGGAPGIPTSPRRPFPFREPTQQIRPIREQAQWPT